MFNYKRHILKYNFNNFQNNIYIHYSFTISSTWYLFLVQIHKLIIYTELGPLI